jgi:hypothetical protein
VLAGGAEWFSDRGELRLFIQISNDLITTEAATNYWAQWLLGSERFFQAAGAKGPFGVKLAAIGLNKLKLLRDWSGDGPLAMDDRAEIERQITSFADGELVPLLDEAEERLADAFAVSPTPGLGVKSMANARSSMSSP